MVTELLKGVYRLEVPLPGHPLRQRNCYLFRSGDRNLLVDAGPARPECRKAVLDRLRELRADPGRTDILVCHLHPDLPGLLPEPLGSGSRLYLSETDALCRARYRDRSRRAQREEYVVRLGFPREDFECIEADRAGETVPRQPCEYGVLRDGDRIELGDHRLRLIETPGHTPGHLCVYLEDRNILLTGDHVLFDATPHVSVWPELPHALDSYLQSLKKISLLDVRAAYAAHGSAQGNLLDRVGELLSHHQMRLNNTLEVVRRHPGKSGSGIAENIRWAADARTWKELSPARRWRAVGETAAHLDHLEQAGKIRRELAGDCYRYWPTERNGEKESEWL